MDSTLTMPTQDMPAPQAPVTLLSVDAVSAELGCSTIEVRRLIALGLLKATRLGTDGEWKTTATNLTDYVGRGAPRLKLAEFDSLAAADWFSDGWIQHSASQLEGEIFNAAQERFPSDADLKAEFASKGTDFIQLEIEPTGAVNSLLGRAIPAQWLGGRPTGESDTRFTDWGALFSVAQLRIAASQVLQEGKYMGKPRLASLYDSPEAFASITTAAWSRARQRNLSQSRTLSVAINPRVQASVTNCRCNLRLSVAKIMGRYSQASLVSAAF